MKLTITIEMDGEQTADLTMGELRVALLPVPRKVTEIIAARFESFLLFDSNGNTVGEAKVEL